LCKNTEFSGVPATKVSSFVYSRRMHGGSEKKVVPDEYRKNFFPYLLVQYLKT
jgi:hypothetical protein